MTVTEEQILAKWDRIIELLEEQTELLKQISSKLKSTAPRRRREGINFEVARKLANRVMKALRASPDYKAGIDVLKVFLKIGEENEKEFEDALQYLERQGRIKIDRETNMVVLVAEQLKKSNKERVRKALG